MTPRVTVGLLIYQGQNWLDLVLRGIKEAITTIPYRVCVVANDPTPAIEQDPRVTHVHRNPDPDEYVMRRVYRAWNTLLERAETDYVVLLNSDMVVSDYWLDELWDARFLDGVPTSLLVETGSHESAYPDYVKDFGRAPETFQWDAWQNHVAQIRQPKVYTAGALYMPCLLERKVALAVGGYPLQQKGEPPGDVTFFHERLQRCNFCCLGSVVYHMGPYGEAGKPYG